MPMKKPATERRTQPRPLGRPSTKRLLAVFGAAAALAAASLLASASSALAAGETVGGCVIAEAIHAEEAYGSLHAVEEMPDVLKGFEKDLEACLKSPNPILPATDEIIWGGGAFAVLFVFMWLKGYPAVKKAMDARADKIRSDLDAADQAKSDAQVTRSEYEAQLAEARTAAAAIIDEAREQAEKLRVDLQARAEADIAEQRTRSAADIEASRRQAIDDLRSEVAAIAVGAAERVVSASLDAEVHRALIDGYIDEVAAGAASNGHHD